MNQPDAPRGKGLIRSLSRKGSRSDKSPTVAVKRRRGQAPKEPSICQRCGAVYSRKRWGRREALPQELLAKAAWVECPACEQQEKTGLCYGRVIASGRFAQENLDAIVRRVRNVERRAGLSQPERRIVSAEWDGERLEVLTTSQKLAHRIGRELEKAFGGRTRYRWSSVDGSLYAAWRHELG